MYIPGRSRTGSSPSRTVMSLAVYVASLIEKALATGRFRAPRILPEHTVRIALGEAQCSGFCDDLAKVLVLDFGGHLRGPRAVFGRRLDGARSGCFGDLHGRFRKRADDVAQSRRRERSQRFANARVELPELECPRGRARVHEQSAVPRDARRPGVACDLRTDGGRPRLDET